MSEKLMLWSDRKTPPVPCDDPFQPYLSTSLLAGDEPRGAVIVLPGGGYHFRAAHEGMCVAERFNSFGFHAFVLEYRVAPYVYPAPQEDVLRAVKLVRHNAAKWHVKADKIAVLGFSAGGHAACSAGIVFDEVKALNGDEADPVSARPDAMILCYPVITAKDPLAHHGSFVQLLGRELNEEEIPFYSWDKRVKENTPPAFLWHTAEDTCVPCENSMLFAQALKEKKIPVEFHLFPRGHHGMSLGTDDLFPEVRVWPELANVFLRNMGW